MKNITRFTLIAVATLSISVSAFSQKAIKKADEAFEAHQYFTALNMYKSAYAGASKNLKGMLLYKMGVSCQEINDYKGAEANYQKAIAANFDDPGVYLRLA